MFSRLFRKQVAPRTEAGGKGHPGSKIEAHDLAQKLRLGLQRQQVGDFGTAEELYGEVLAVDADNFDALHLLGLVAHQTGRSTIGAALIGKAISINPDAGMALSNLGNIYMGLGRDEDAKKCLQRAVVLVPEHAGAHYNLALLLARQGRFVESRTCCQRALAINPEFLEARWVGAITRFPAIFDSTGKPDEDLDALAAELHELDAWFDPRRSQEGYKAVGILQPLMLAYREQENRKVLQMYGQLCARLMREWQASQSLFPVKKSRSDRIRVGIVSRHIREHSIWQAVTKGWFQNLNRDRFELHAFHLTSEADAETDYAKSRAESFQEGNRNLHEWVQLILAKESDVLLYPEIGMDAMTLRLASLRLAPVQATTWGHPETSGLPTIDYYGSSRNRVGDFEGF